MSWWRLSFRIFAGPRGRLTATRLIFQQESTAAEWTFEILLYINIYVFFNTVIKSALSHENGSDGGLDLVSPSNTKRPFNERKADRTWCHIFSFRLS